MNQDRINTIKTANLMCYTSNGIVIDELLDEVRRLQTESVPKTCRTDALGIGEAFVLCPECAGPFVYVVIGHKAGLVQALTIGPGTCLSSWYADRQVYPVTLDVNWKLK